MKTIERFIIIYNYCISMAKTKYTSVSIPIPLANKVKKIIKNSGFKSLSDYVTYILREIVAGKKEFERGELKQLKERLKALGYL